MHAQISLPIRLRDWAGLDNFYLPPGSANQPLLALLATADWHTLLIHGPAGSGKTHLLQACCRVWQEQQQVRVIYLPLGELGAAGPSVLEGLDSYDLIALDDLDDIAGQRDWEEALFHLYNALQQRSGRLLVAAAATPSELPVELADLRSRLLSGSSWRLERLDESHLRAALVQRAERLGFNLPDLVLDYLFRRYSRDSKSLFDLLEELDGYAFDQQRQLTVPLIGEFLREREGAGHE